MDGYIVDCIWRVETLRRKANEQKRVPKLEGREKLYSIQALSLSRVSAALLTSVHGLNLQ